jgi:hypothetical protein
LAEDEAVKEKAKTVAKPKVDIKVKPSPSNTNGIKLNSTATSKTNTNTSKADVKLPTTKTEPVKEESLFDFDRNIIFGFLFPFLEIILTKKF